MMPGRGIPWTDCITGAFQELKGGAGETKKKKKTSMPRGRRKKRNGWPRAGRTPNSVKNAIQRVFFRVIAARAQEGKKRTMGTAENGT